MMGSTFEKDENIGQRIRISNYATGRRLVEPDLLLQEPEYLLVNEGVVVIIGDYTFWGSHKESI